MVKIFGKSIDIGRLLPPNALTIVEYLKPEEAEFQMAAMFYLQKYGIGLDVEEC